MHLDGLSFHTGLSELIWDAYVGKRMISDHSEPSADTEPRETTTHPRSPSKSLFSRNYPLTIADENRISKQTSAISSEIQAIEMEPPERPEKASTSSGRVRRTRPRPTGSDGPEDKESREVRRLAAALAYAFPARSTANPSHQIHIEAPNASAHGAAGV
jgi:hypothetical protein